MTFNWNPKENYWNENMVKLGGKTTIETFANLLLGTTCK